MARDPASSVMLEKRILLAVTGFVGIGFLAWIIAVSTDYWYVIDSPKGTLLHNQTGHYFMRSHAGLWRTCRTEYFNISTNHTSSGLTRTCSYFDLFPTKDDVKRDPTVDRHILHFRRTEVSFSVISIILIMMAICVSLYTFKEPRYMFKRLAAGLYFFSAGTVIIVIEVVTEAISYRKNFLPVAHPKGADWYYGFSFMLAWICFVTNIVGGLSFLIGSRKRKGKKAATELQALADEPTILGRV